MEAPSTTRARRLAGLADIPVARLAGVGPRRVKGLAGLGIETVLDLLWHVPRRYIDRTTQPPIEELAKVQLEEGQELTVIGVVGKVSRRQIPRRRLTIFEATITDGTGTLQATWFNQPGLARKVAPGRVVAVSGSLKWFRGRPQLQVTAIEPLGDAPEEGEGALDLEGAGTELTGRIVPVHAASAEAPPWFIREVMREALARSGDLLDPIPPALLDEYGLMPRTDAFRTIHFPDDLDSARAARNRLVYDELFVLEVSLAIRKKALLETARGFVNQPGGPLWNALTERLPFTLTGGQQRALDDIGADLAGEQPMHRLIQGEVGSGKTAIALHALLAAVDAGRQAAIMAPTEVLAEQHFEGIGAQLADMTVASDDNLLGSRPLGIALLTNRTTGAERTRIVSGLAGDNGMPPVDIVIGTHALIQEGIAIPRLAVAVIDEQHRFGVHQRVALRERGGTDADMPEPDVLIMTATPIPRTLAMTLYGDLDVTTIAELPPGRQPIETVVVGPGGAGRAKAYEHVRAEVAAGRQAYVICPLVEESDQLEVTSAVAEHARLSEGELSGLEVGLLHGQMRPADKHAAMQAFRGGTTDVLVATTVVEVGVDVPNASVMIIEDADRFGLSQLHQLRGRIGRGSAASTCYLFADPTTPDAEARMEAMAAHSNGFDLADRDLEIRGEGSLMGARQSGRSDLHVTRLVRDIAWVQRARDDAFALIDADPRLTDEAHDLLRDEVLGLVGDDVEWLRRS